MLERHATATMTVKLQGRTEKRRQKKGRKEGIKQNAQGHVKEKLYF